MPETSNIHTRWTDAPDAISLIDAHHHLWDLGMGRHPNLMGERRHDFFMGDDSAMRRNYLPADYRRDAAGHNVLTTVHCEAEWDRSDQLGETRWVSAIAKEHGFPGAIVAHAWFHTPNAEEILAAQAHFPLVRGIRSKPVTSALAGGKHRWSAGHDAGPAWLAGFALLEKYELSWDLRVPYWHLGEAAAVAHAFPDTRSCSTTPAFRGTAAKRGSPRGAGEWRCWRANPTSGSRFPSSGSRTARGTTRRTAGSRSTRFRSSGSSARCSPATSRWPVCASATGRSSGR